MLSGSTVKFAMIHRFSILASISNGSGSLVPPATSSTNERMTASIPSEINSRCRGKSMRDVVQPCIIVGELRNP